MSMRPVAISAKSRGSAGRSILPPEKYEARFARYWRSCLARRKWLVRVSPEYSRLAGSQPAFSTWENLKSA
jgi:hypothetical protein